MSIYCPMCASRCVRRSKRQGLAEHTVLTALLVMPFRCVECGWRFFRLSFRRNRKLPTAFGEQRTDSGKRSEVLVAKPAGST